jgi:threonine/homoserine/homoserine lactone efflux protein
MTRSREVIMGSPPEVLAVAAHYTLEARNRKDTDQLRRPLPHFAQALRRPPVDCQQSVGYHRTKTTPRGSAAIDATAIVAYLSKALVLGFSACIMPGPFQTYLISETLRRGWRRGLLVSFAPLASDGPIILVVLFMLTRLPGWTLYALQVVGGLFIFYLAWGAWRASRQSPTAATQTAAEQRKSLVQAATVNLLSPGVYLFWATVSGPLLAEGWNSSPGLGAGFLFCFYGALVGTELAIVALVSGVRRLNPAVTRWLLGASALLMAVLGVVQLAAGLKGLLL